MHTVECRYNAVQYSSILHRTEAEYQSDAESTKYTPYLVLTDELWGVFVNICEKIDRVITAPHCI